tara:strand:- start:688 stop:975 length:288 start_codon:yes stop_codon:yes gene_type:complete
MAIKINEKWYDETKFSNELKHAIVQISVNQNAAAKASVEQQNSKILSQWYSKFVMDNVPAAAETEAPKDTSKAEEVKTDAAEAPAEEAPAETPAE